MDNLLNRANRDSWEQLENVQKIIMATWQYDYIDNVYYSRIHLLVKTYLEVLNSWLSYWVKHCPMIPPKQQKQWKILVDN